MQAPHTRSDMSGTLSRGDGIPHELQEHSAVPIASGSFHRGNAGLSGCWMRRPGRVKKSVDDGLLMVCCGILLRKAKTRTYSANHDVSCCQYLPLLVFKGTLEGRGMGHLLPLSCSRQVSHGHTGRNTVVSRSPLRWELQYRAS